MPTHISGTLPTDRRFTGQRWEQGLGLYDYNARWYHPALGRFVSADTVVPEPGNPQSLNRFAYVYNNPLQYLDPDGHDPEIPGDKPEDEPWHIDALGWRLDLTGSLSAFGGDTAVGATAGCPPLSALVLVLVHTGVDFNVDAILNLNDQETGEWKGVLYAMRNAEENLDICVSSSAQFITMGGGVSTGPLAITNLTNNDDLEGVGWELGGTAIFPSGGGELEFFFQPTEEGDFIKGAYLAPGPSAGVELSAGIGVGHTWNITDRVFKTKFGFE